MSEIGDKIQEKCMAFGDRVIKLNDYLLEQECKKEGKMSAARGEAESRLRLNQ